MIDFKVSILNSMVTLYENTWHMWGILFLLGLGVLFYRDYTYNDYRERKYLLNVASKFIALPIMFTVGYVIALGYGMLLLISVVSLLLTYFLYYFGFFDIIIEKWN